MVCAARKRSKALKLIRPDGSTHCMSRREVRKLARRWSPMSPEELNVAERALIKKGLVAKFSSDGSACLIFKGSTQLIPCVNVLRKKLRRK